jgi:DNA polymerase-1
MQLARRLRLSGITSAEKDSMRGVVIRGGPWSWEERNAILGYCETDVRGLVELLPKMLPLIHLPQAVHRGRYMHAVACMEYVGVPIDVETLTVLQERWTDIQDALIAKIDSAYHVFEGRTFKLQKFTEYLIRNNISWPGLKSGQLDLSDGAFKDRSRAYPALLNLRYLRNALSKLRLNDLTVGHDGFNRSGLSPFQSRTGRNQPSNSKFIFGAASWLRGLIKPPRGYGLCYIDRVQQEFAIAAALSGDPAMIMAYEGGDSYLWFAKETGDVPPDATRKTHGAKREQFKQCVLGTQYGIGEEALADRIGQSIKMGRHLLRLHRETFRRYWEWVDGALNTAFLTTSQATVYGWMEKITEANCNPRAIANFFCQANGAEMLRLACCFGTERGIQICAPVHDAILIMAPLDQLEADIAAMRECMEQACDFVLAGFKLRTDIQIIRFPERYACEKGKDMWRTVMELL